MERDRRLAEVLKFDVPPDQPPQLAIGHEMITSSARTADHCAHADRKDVLPLEVVPHPAQLSRGLRRLGPRCDECGVEGSDRGADQKVGRDAQLVQRFEHPDLQCPETRAARENERRARARSAGGGEAPRAIQRDHGAYLNGWRNASAASTGATPKAIRPSERMSRTTILVCPVSRSHSSLTVSPSLCRLSSSTNIERPQSHAAATDMPDAVCGRWSTVRDPARRKATVGRCSVCLGETIPVAKAGLSPFSGTKRTPAFA